jgi:hypothetical protein
MAVIDAVFAPAFRRGRITVYRFELRHRIPTTLCVRTSQLNLPMRRPTLPALGVKRATYDLLVAAKQVIAERWRPDGYTVGWNVGAAGGQEIFHAHLRVIPGFDDEPQAGRGIRWAIKQTTNRRPNPDAPGRGLA